MLFQYFFIPLCRNSRYDVFKNRSAVFLLFLVLAAIILVTGCMTENPRSAPGGTMGTLTFYTEDNYPYNYLENGTLKGITPDLFEKITETMGDRVSRERIRLVPWSEGYQAALPAITP